MAKLDEVLVCKALGDPNRMKIVKMLSDQEKCGCKECLTAFTSSKHCPDPSFRNPVMYHSAYPDSYQNVWKHLFYCRYYLVLCIDQSFFNSEARSFYINTTVRIPDKIRDLIFHM